VEIAELGRGVLLASQANTRIALDDLAERAPRLLGRFRWVCDKLNTPGFPADERKRWWSDYDRLLADIRAQPGLADFVAAPRFADLRNAAAGGSVVVVNAGRHRGDAIIIHADTDPVAVRLPDLQMTSVEDRVTTLLAAVEDDHSLTRQLQRRRVVPETLRWLWDAVVAPITDALATDHLHRVWWLPTGLLGLLPIHAAGYPGQPGALDLLTSSYVPSLRALRQARTQSPATRRDAVTVAMHHTPGQPDLVDAAREATLDGTPLHDERATADGVLDALCSANWAHFACHAVVDPASQADSGLLLYDRILRLSEIGGLRLTQAELAYLSACSTANHGIASADEVLHLSAAFQLAGFRHVIASLWPLYNDIAVQAANSFYRAMADAPADTAAAVLRDVTRELRDRYPDHPHLWAPLIHSGP
jgi:CHAT domain-containing protein